ncbi:hypothetical protein [Algoriphagus hitonicola]|uniref:Addiction module component n=1 Tax=Algoriphagus hitonicola TaxID=435880 RepID=A0A1I2SGI6_9BACT|nr:hypothetical protein [Algoriphagus hitonicola]SFG49141.1 hypothetical protein SAMN04487988_104173 [Algoriphagus hitonicola]
MDLQTRKLKLIQRFLKIDSEDILIQLEEILKIRKKSQDTKAIDPMSIEEFNSRIDRSMEDSKNGRLVEDSELKSNIEKWN